MDCNEISELLHCKDDISYFANKYIKINDVKYGIKTITLNDLQENVILDFNNSNYVAEISSRQSGKTTVAAIILLHQALFNRHRTYAIVGNKLISSNYILDCIVKMYELLPEFLKVKIEGHNKSELKFANGCNIISTGSSSNRIRGVGISLLYCDEYKYIKDFNDFLDYIVPTITSSKFSKVFMLSSA